MAERICCSLMNCSCDSFRPGKLKRRQCDNCKHGWVSHALSKLKVQHMYQSSQVEIVHSNVVFDICSLMLYGTEAIPIRLKILLDRLFSVLKQDEVVQILSALDWTLQDYIRGYILQDDAGKVLDRWAIMTFEEELATLQQFLRFGETKSIVELMALQDKEGQSVLVPSTRTNSDIRTFIERKNPQKNVNLSSIKTEKVNGNNMHHFENFINSMSVMLPFQLAGSIPGPSLGSATGPGSLLQQQDKQMLVRENLLYHSHAAGTSSVLFENDVDQCEDKPIHCFSSSSPKIETEDFSTSDNYSDGPSTPRTPSFRSDVTQMSPDGKLRPLERSRNSCGASSGGGSLKKGRVFCSACEKTFYDKGTLKIHYNAVHLKIKHKCTIEGCNMVFSSLRSRNRHSANPNPRLHMPMNRNNRDKDLRSELSADDVSHCEKTDDCGTSVCSEENNSSISSYMVSHVETGSRVSSSCFSSIGQSGILFPNLKTVQPVLPFYRSLVTPAELANTPGSLPSLPLLSSVSATSVPAPEFCPIDMIPKKKSRKSSMPIKIEKDSEVDHDEHIKTGSSAGDGVIGVDQDQCDRRIIQVEVENDACGGGQQEGTQHVDGDTMGCSQCPSDHEAAEKHRFGQELNGKETSDLEEQTRTAETDRMLEKRWCENHLRLIGDHIKLLDPDKEGLEGFEDDFMDTGVPVIDDSSDRCEICSKTFKNPFNAKLHYKNAHMKEMHMCTVDGCNAAFASRRSRDRHSGNSNLHHKLLTRDTIFQSHLLNSSSSICRFTDDFQETNGRDSCSRESNGQPSVIFSGHNRMGLVFPINKISKVPDSSNVVEDGMVLDLSTSSYGPTRGSLKSFCDSEGARSDGGECLEEDHDQLPIEDSDESSDGINVGRDGEEECSTEVLENHGAYGGRQFGLQGSGLPITCHICHKIYSNKGTFRAHYKTVHLRLLHKCKVPGCDTSFSSVRSRNRHSQNPNLHKNLAIVSGAPIDQD